uniref:Uncharacterized protein n=1 Tax=Glossina palpalis gambiensis TaxID=67801 RepID=A0A1B0C4V4_9MUSC
MTCVKTMKTPKMDNRSVEIPPQPHIKIQNHTRYNGTTSWQTGTSVPDIISSIYRDRAGRSQVIALGAPAVYYAFSNHAITTGAKLGNYFQLMH